MIKVLYFASIREVLGRDQDQLQVNTATTVDSLIDELVVIHGELWHQMLRNKKVLVAINQTVATLDAAISEGDEIAFFPPVTGG